MATAASSKFRRCVFAVSLLLGGPRVDGGTIEATIEVRLAAPDGGEISQAVVRLRPESDPTRSWEVRSAGSATFTGLIPGRYTVGIEAPGSISCQQTVDVSAGGLLVLAVRLPTSGGSEPACSFRARRAEAFGTVFTEDELRDLPSSRNVWSFLEVADPAAILDRMDNGGLATGEPGRFGIRGSSWTQASIHLGGLDVTDPVETGTPMVFPDVDALTAMGAFSALLPVEAGGPGPILALTPRRPGSRWTGAAEAHASEAGLQSVNSRAGVPSIARLGSWWDLNATASGPIVRDRLGATMSLGWTRLRRFDRDDPAEVRARVSSLLAYGVWTPTPKDEVQGLVVVQGLSRPHPGGARFRVHAQEDGTSMHLQSTWERRRASGATAWAGGGYQRASFDPSIDAPSDRPVERLRDAPLPELLFPGPGSREKWDFGGGLRLASRSLGGGRHLPRIGFQVARVRSAGDAASPSGITAELVDGLPARLWDYAYAGRSQWRALDGALYAADHLILGDRVTAEVGLRFEASRGSAAGGRTRISWLSLSPRSSARLRLTELGRISLLGGYGLYRHRLPLRYLAFGDPSGPQGQVHRWNDTNGDRLFQPGESGVLIARVGPGAADGVLASLDPHLKPPVTREFVAGIEGRLGDVTLRFTGFDRKERKLVESVNVGVTAAGYRVTRVPDPGGDLVGPGDDQLLPIYDREPASFGQDRYVLTNPPGHTGHFQGLELTLAGSLAGRLRFLMGATASRTEAPGSNRGFRAQENDQGVIGELFDQPNADTHAAGRTFFDRAYTIKVSGTYRAPGDVRLGVAARYQDGQPFSRLVIAKGLQQGPEAIQAVPNSRHRFSFTITVDARIEKGFGVGRGRMAAIVEGFNLLNNRQEVEEDVVDGPAFRTPTAVQPPRALRLGLRWDF